ncbi:hypothetical protein J6590_082684 [Homalodisca vitripennis]|nr:hypothetical protein J6590_082684 [Homalodisca vitripennis]
MKTLILRVFSHKTVSAVAGVKQEPLMDRPHLRKRIDNTAVRISYTSIPSQVIFPSVAVSAAAQGASFIITAVIVDLRRFMIVDKV